MDERLEARVNNFVAMLLLGPGRPDRIPRQGCRNAVHLVRREWRRERFSGFVRLFRLFVHLLSFVLPIILVDTLADCIIRPAWWRIDARVVAVYRDAYYMARFVFLALILILGGYSSDAAAWFSGYLVVDIMHGLIGGALVWGRYSINPARSVVLALVNYAEVTSAFAVLYLNRELHTCQYLNVLLGTPTRALYFSMVTGATVGFGDIYPKEGGHFLVMCQIAIFVMFVLFLLTTLVSRLPAETRRK